MDSVKVLVHSFTMTDTEDPEIYAGQPIWEWQQSEAGKFVMEHALATPVYTINTDFMTLGYHCRIWANLTQEDTTFFNLKYCDHSNSKTMG